jgi:hypothetical protein
VQKRNEALRNFIFPADLIGTGDAGIVCYIRPQKYDVLIFVMRRDQDVVTFILVTAKVDSIGKRKSLFNTIEILNRDSFVAG